MSVKTLHFPVSVHPLSPLSLHFSLDEKQVPKEKEQQRSHLERMEDNQIYSFLVTELASVPPKMGPSSFRKD